MTSLEILNQRLFNQQLNGTKIQSPKELVAWFGAVQAQDYTGAKWALGQRLNLNDLEIEKAYNNGEILRTHAMRPTWHFVSPSNLRWLQQLTSPRVKMLMAYYNKKLGLTPEIFQKSKKVFEIALGNGEALTRTQLSTSLEVNGIKARGQMLGHLVMEAELDGIIVSGPRIGKQFTYMLVDIRVPEFKKISHDEALSRLVKKYFQSHGPAAIKDLCWWSGLTTIDANRGIEMNKPKIKHDRVDGIEYWFFESKASPIPKKVYLLPNYDEYGIAYKLRDVFMAQSGYKIPPNAGQMPFSHMIFKDGILIGLWKRVITPKKLTVDTHFFSKLDKETENRVQVSINSYRKFLGLNSQK